MTLADYIRAMPKVELHVHLEGTVQPETLLALAQTNGVTLPASDAAGLRNWYTFRNFDHFVEIFMSICECLQTPDDFARITYEFGRSMARQNIRYAEVTWTPFTHVNERLIWEALLGGINAGRDRARAEWGVRMRWICDIARHLPDSAQTVVGWLTTPDAQENGVIALGLGGPEAGHPPEPFEAAFQAARAGGLHCIPHAGETAGPASIWGAIRALKAERIGHGVRAIEDAALLDYLVEHRLPLEVNPSSNICLGVYPSYEAHPLRQLLQAGACVTINSDDPALFNTTLNAEYRHAVEDCGLTVAELETAALNAVRSSMLPAQEKTAMEADFRAEYARLRQLHGLERKQTDG
jgi:aminodeoxyfutalosine deaminase